MLRFLINTVLVLVVVLTLCIGGFLAYLIPRLPAIDTLADVQLQEPLRVYDSDGALIAEFGEQRRSPVSYDEVPQVVVNAFVAAEDDRFFAHQGVDWIAIVRAALSLIETGDKRQGGSTITMQVARNFFLTREKTYIRKVNEILLALKIERELSKQKILELYFNKIFLGHRAYGIAAAASVYYGRELSELTLAQAAMIAALPKAPSILNPVSNPERARERRAYVLGRMLDQEFIAQAAFNQASRAPLTAKLHTTQPDVTAPYVAEMVRRSMLERHGDAALTAGYQVYTTIRARLQEAANEAVRRGLLDYDRRHGFRGPEQRLAIDGDNAGRLEHLLRDFAVVNGLLPAVVTNTGEKSIEAYVANRGQITLEWDGIAWARPHIDQDRRGPAPQQAADIVSIGDVIRVMQDDEGNWVLTQLPEVEGALVSVHPESGAVVALVGGFDFYQSKFNRVTQAQRQPGSNFKPFIYAAALDNGYTTASFVNDAPLVFDGADFGDGWRPENYSGKYFGPTRLRDALAKSRNLVSIRLMHSVGIQTTLDYVGKFRFDTEKLPHDLSLSLGSGSITPWELVRGYMIFANSGHTTDPYFIDRILDADGQVLEHTEPPALCRDCGPVNEPGLAQQVVDPQNAWLVTSMMQDVIRRGTGRKALALNRSDLAGKTGTTNDQKDAWFSGFNTELVTTTWIGFDDARPLGRRETGAVAALPMWIEFMRVALDGVPESPVPQPAGLLTIRIDPSTGLPASAGHPRAIFETFREDQVPHSTVPQIRDQGLEIPEQLF